MTTNSIFTTDRKSLSAVWQHYEIRAVSRETPEGSRSSRAQNVLDPELTQDYISQVSEEIEGRVTMKLLKEFSKLLERTKLRILGALSKLDEFLLNPQFRTCSLTVPGTPRNNISENRETTGDRSSDDPYPKWCTFLIALVTSTAQRQKTTLTWWQELQKKLASTLTWWQQLKKRFPTAPLVFRQGNKRRRAP